MKSTTVRKLAKVVRSKNAGPFELTYDIIFKSAAMFRKVQTQSSISRPWVRRVLGVKDHDILGICWFEPASALKITVRRTVSSGSPADRDVYGAQQHVPLMNAKVEWKK